MKVNFNNLRKQTAYSLDRVIRTLNDGIMTEKGFCSYQTKDGSYKQKEGDLLVSTSDLQRDLDMLRMDIWTLLCCYEEGNPDYKCVFEEVEETGGIARFNEREDEELDS